MSVQKEAFQFLGCQVKGQGHTIRFKVKPNGQVLSQIIGPKSFKLGVYLLCQ